MCVSLYFISSLIHRIFLIIIFSATNLWLSYHMLNEDIEGYTASLYGLGGAVSPPSLSQLLVKLYELEQEQASVVIICIFVLEKGMIFKKTSFLS